MIRVEGNFAATARKNLGRRLRVLTTKATRPNQKWSMDLMSAYSGTTYPIRRNAADQIAALSATGSNRMSVSSTSSRKARPS